MPKTRFRPELGPGPYKESLQRSPRLASWIAGPLCGGGAGRGGKEMAEMGERMDGRKGGEMRMEDGKWRRKGQRQRKKRGGCSYTYIFTNYYPPTRPLVPGMGN